MKLQVFALAAVLSVASCAQKVEQGARGNDADLRALSEEIARLKAEKDQDLARIEELERKLIEKRNATALAAANTKLLSERMSGHTRLYPIRGKYKVMVIPVQFSDVKFERGSFYTPDASGKAPAQDYLFGDHPDSLSNYYRHVSYGNLQVSGEITPVITVDKPLEFYGEAVAGNSDRAARTLVVDALQKLKAIKTSEGWWEQFDRWDLTDYDGDANFYEPDGFMDAVVLVYAGKDQASCQRSFDPKGTRPASADVPPGPRHDAAVECFNRIWPHRWSLSLASTDPLYSKDGPEVEGLSRPSMNGLKINDGLFALDYNMQSEFSDRSTFIHEFGHSLTLPDVYSSSGSNSTGQWETMSSNAHLQAQEMSSYSRLSLGWLAPKVVPQGQVASAYLGHGNFVPALQRDKLPSYGGPSQIEETVDGKTSVYDVVSETPEFGEPVYRSLVVLTDPTVEKYEVVKPAPSFGHFSAYSGRYDGESRAVKLKLQVPATGDMTLKFDTVYHVETETNFESKEEAIKIVTPYDIGEVAVNGDVLEEFHTISGDENFDTLAEKNPACEATRVLDLRRLKNAGTATPAEVAEFETKAAVCQSPYAVTKSYDLSKYQGQEVVFEVRYVTDGGYNDMGIVVDNIRLGTQTVDFESSANRPLGQWELLEDGLAEKLWSQFYLMEYRDPSETFGGLSYNMDLHIQAASTQAMFMGAGPNLLDRFRMVRMEAQPGLLVWYFNSKFGRTENNPESQDGKGYLLVLNSKVKEVKLPGVWSDPSLVDADGAYKTDEQAFKDLVAAQRADFKCFGYTQYATYVDGVVPDCAYTQDADALRKLSFEGRSLVYSRDGYNNYLPVDQYAMEGVGEPFRSSPEFRSSLSTFRPKDFGAFAPAKVYKAVGGQMVLDTQLTSAAEQVAPVSEFNDADNQLATNPRFAGDTVVVEKKGLHFRVVSPNPAIQALYRKDADPSANDNFFRRPRVKVLIDWAK